VGSPGAGKTLAAAKIARHTRNLPHGFKAVSADFANSGGHARLSAYTDHVDIGLFKSADALKSHVNAHSGADRQLIIDGPAFNPVKSKEMEALKDLIDGLNAEPVLVISAEGHPFEIADNARAFANLGIKRAIITKLDAVRRRGGVFSALSSVRLSIAQLSLSQSMPDGLIPATPLRIARLLLETAPENGSGSEMSFRGAA
jgi:flagellar biosynthesis protein FlhF